MTSILSHLFSGLARYEQTADGRLIQVPDMAKTLPEPVDNGDDTFTYAYLQEAIARNKDGSLMIQAKDDHTLKVTTVGRLSYWNELLAHPVFFPVRKDVAKAVSLPLLPL